METHIKIDGICVGMSKVDAWDILKEKGIYKCDPNAISTIGTTNFQGVQVSVMYSFNSRFVINKIRIMWTKKQYSESSRIGKISKNDLHSVYASFINYFGNILPVKGTESKIFSNNATYEDLYNHIHILKQDARDEGNPSFECVLITISDFVEHIKDESDRNDIIRARNAYILRGFGDGYWQNNNQKNKRISFPINYKSIVMKCMLVIIGVVLAYIVASSYRYNTFKDKNKFFRYDKWTERYEKYDIPTRQWMPI